jgi:3-methyladenine DNA glycosylase AlkD
MSAPVTPSTPSDLIAAVRKGLERQRDPKKAGPMQAYAKSAMPYYGVQAPTLREVCAVAFEGHLLTTAASWRQAIIGLWDGATHQELRYAAIELAAYPPYQRFVSMALVPLYRRLIQEGAWWDTVDPLSARVAVLLRTYPAPLSRTLRAWAKQDNIWLRRVAIIAQVGARDATDRELLYDCIAPSLGSKEFFLRKAIGWALREYAKALPDEVRRYLAAHRGEVSPLSLREAEKGFQYVKRHGPIHKTKRR